MAAQDDLNSILTRLKSGIDILVLRVCDVEIFSSKIKCDLVSLQSHRDYKVDPGSDQTFVEICAIAFLETRYVGKRLAGLLGRIKALSASEMFWRPSGHNPSSVAFRLVSGFHFKENDRTQFSDQSSKKKIELLREYLEEHVPSKLPWAPYLSSLDSLTLTTMVGKLHKMPRIFDAECASYLIFCQASFSQDTRSWSAIHLERLQKILPDFEISDVFVGKQLYVFDTLLRKSIYFEFSMLLIMTIFPCLAPLYAILRKNLEANDEIAENMMFPPYKRDPTRPYAYEGGNFMTYLFHAITLGLKHPYMETNFSYQKLILNLFAWESIAVSQGFRPMKLSIYPILQQMHSKYLKKLEKHLMRHHLHVAFALVVSDVAKKVFDCSPCNGLRKKKSKLWMKIRFGLDVYGKNSIIPLEGFRLG